MASGRAPPLLSEQREENITKTGWHFSRKRMKKKSLLSVVGTHPDPSQVALEVSEAGPGRGRTNTKRLRAMWRASEASQRRVTNPSAKYGPAGSQRDTRTDVQCRPTSLGRVFVFQCHPPMQSLLKPPSFWRARAAGVMWRAAPATPKEL